MRYVLSLFYFLLIPAEAQAHSFEYVTYGIMAFLLSFLVTPYLIFKLLKKYKSQSQSGFLFLATLLLTILISGLIGVATSFGYIFLFEL